MNLLIYNGKKFLIDGKMAFHFWETYGFPPEVFEEQVNSKLSNPKARKIQCALALKEYGNKHIADNNR